MNAPAASRTLAILQLLAASPEPMAAGHIARELGIPRASLYRLLATMAEHGFVVSVAESSAWALGVEAYELAWAYERQTPLQRMARPLLARLVDATGVSGHFTVLRGTDVIYAIEERAPRSPSLVTDVGVRLPAHLTASGLAMLSAMGSRQIRSLYPKGVQLEQRSGVGPRTRGDLMKVLEETRVRGFAVEQDSVTEGFSSVALPVLDRAGHPLASVALTYRSDEVRAEDRDGLVEAVRRTVASLGRRLGAGRG